MFFGYPIAATAENWLHTCLVDMVRVIHADAQNGTATQWPQIIPGEYRERLRRKTGLRDRLQRYRGAVAGLAPELRNQVEMGLTQQNRIGELCSGAEDCETLDQLPEPCRAPIADLFGFAFSLLADVGVLSRFTSIWTKRLS